MPPNKFFDLLLKIHTRIKQTPGEIPVRSCKPPRRGMDGIFVDGEIFEHGDWRRRTFVFPYGVGYPSPLDLANLNPLKIMTNLEKARKYPHTVKRNFAPDQMFLGQDEILELRPIRQLGFKPEFVPMVEAGIKLQTIRGNTPAMRRILPGDALHFMRGRYTSGANRMFGWGICTETIKIWINDKGIAFETAKIHNRKFNILANWSDERLNIFARADGFESADAMKAWFEKRYAKNGQPLNFGGVLIKWEIFNPWKI